MYHISLIISSTVLEIFWAFDGVQRVYEQVLSSERGGERGRVTVYDKNTD